MIGFKIKIFTSDGDQSVSVGKSHLTIGRAAHCDVQPPGEAASEHLRVWTDGNHLWGQDLGSEIGTSVNGTRLQAMRPVLFRENDIFKIGDAGTSLGFELLTEESRAAGPAVEKALDLVEETTNPQIKKLTQENKKLRTMIEDLRQQMKNSATTPEEVEEVSQVKQNALSEVKSMKEDAARRFENLKRESVQDLEEAVISKIQFRPGGRISKDEVTADVSAALRSVLLGEKTSAKVRRSSFDTGFKYVFLLVLAGMLCLAYVARGRWTNRRPASVVYIPPHPAQVTYVKSNSKSNKANMSAKETGQE